MENPDTAVENRQRLGRSSFHPTRPSQTPGWHKMECSPSASAPVIEDSFNMKQTQFLDKNELTKENISKMKINFYIYFKKSHKKIR